MELNLVAIQTLKRFRGYGKLILLLLILLLITGCVEQTVKIIVIPARTGGGGIIGFLFLAALISAVFDRPKAITPEQAQYVDSLVHEERQLLPSVSPNINYTTTDVILSQSIAVVESNSLSPHQTFQVFSQPTNNSNAGWQQQELVDVTVEGDGSVNRRVLFHMKNNIENNKILITWDLPPNGNQKSRRQNATEAEGYPNEHAEQRTHQPFETRTPNQSKGEGTRPYTQQQLDRKSNPDYFDPSGL